MRPFTVTPSTPLKTTFDPEDRIARAAPGVTVKGMFIAPHAEAAGAAFREIEPRLLKPPRDGRYVGYMDYPLADYYRVVFAGAARAHPHLPLAEACRQAARAHIQAFAGSTVGKVMLAMITDARGALLALPQMFARGSQGIVVEAEPRDDGVRVEMRRIGGVQDCSAIGTIEGCVIFYGSEPTIDVELISTEHAAYEVTWR